MKMQNFDFNQMQQQAIRNAQEMHKRAMPPPNRNPLNSILNSLNGLFKDNDTILIMAMILLLSRDGGDKMLIMALLYIMS